MDRARRQPIRSRVLLQCWLWFFLVLLAYYLLKPVRDGYGSVLARRLGDLYLGTFLATLVLLPLYSKWVSRVSRLWLVNGITQFFVLCLVAFLIGFRASPEPPVALVATFFIWVSVFNLFIVTVFWSVMADVFTSHQGENWFGSMAAAGSLGSLTGSAVAYAMSTALDPVALLVAAIVCLELIALNAWWLLRSLSAQPNRVDVESQADVASESELPVAGGMWAGVRRVLESPYLLGIAVFVAIGKLAATFVYNNLQLTMETSLPAANERTVLFSQMNIWSQGGSLLLQAVVAPLLLRWAGVGLTLAIPCVALLGLFLYLGLHADLWTLVIGQVGQQILGYGLLVPAQHVLFTVVSREDKYKTKAFVDTVVFRGSDVAAGKLCQWMIATGASVSLLAVWMLPSIAVWLAVAVGLGWGYNRRQAESRESV